MDRGCARCSVRYSMCSYVFYGHGWIEVVPSVVCVIQCVLWTRMDRGCARCSVRYSMCSYVLYGHGWIGIVPGVVCVIQCVAMCFMDMDG